MEIYLSSLTYINNFRPKRLRISAFLDKILEFPNCVMVISKFTSSFV